MLLHCAASTLQVMDIADRLCYISFTTRLMPICFYITNTHLVPLMKSLCGGKKLAVNMKANEYTCIFVMWQHSDVREINWLRCVEATVNY